MKDRKAADIRRDEQRLLHGLRAHDPLNLEALINQYSRAPFSFARLVLIGAGSVRDAEEFLKDPFVVRPQPRDEQTRPHLSRNGLRHG